MGDVPDMNQKKTCNRKSFKVAGTGFEPATPRV